MSTHPATELLRALFATAPHDLFLEIRPLPAGLLPKDRRFFRLRQLQRRGFDQAVPIALDGHANIYFGVCPRKSPGGKAMDVAMATCLWADLDRGSPEPWPEAIPVPSAVVETSPGKLQAYWLLTEPSTDLAGIERLARALAPALKADRAATDRARVLRLPGFQNLKYGERPVARLLELRPERRYGLEDLRTALPPCAASGNQPVSPQGQQAVPGAFDPHRGGDDVPDVVKQEIAEALRQRGAVPYHDGRLVGPCPFPGHTGHSPQNFSWSPLSGRWWCFGEHHTGRAAEKVCVAGAVWGLWAALFPGRPSPTRDELSTSPPLRRRGEEADNSPINPYEPLVPLPLEALRDAPRHGRSAALLRLVGQTKKAAEEENCGVPLKGQCPRPQHGIVREGRASGKTPWCAGCNTETSARYLHTTFPAGAYSIVRLQKRLGPGDDGPEVKPRVLAGRPEDGAIIATVISEAFRAASEHFRRVQRRHERECLAWHFAVGEYKHGLQVELQVLVFHGPDLEKVLQELTGETRKAALFRPDAAARYDYPESNIEQLRRDWAGVVRCALLRLETDALFPPIFEALNGRPLSQPYGELRDAYRVSNEQRDGQAEDVAHCPVVEEDGRICGRKLTFFLDPDNRYPVNRLVYQRPKAAARAGPGAS